MTTKGPPSPSLDEFIANTVNQHRCYRVVRVEVYQLAEDEINEFEKPFQTVKCYYHNNLKTAEQTYKLQVGDNIEGTVECDLGYDEAVLLQTFADYYGHEQWITLKQSRRVGNVETINL